MKRIVVLLLALVTVVAASFTALAKDAVITDSMLKAASETVIGEKNSFKGITIGFSQRAVAGSGWYENLIRVAQEEAKHLGVKLIVLDAQGNLAKQINDIEDLIARKVDAIIVNPVDPQGIMSAIKKVHAKKIPLINVNSQMVPEAKPLSFVGHNTYSFGYVAGRDLAAMYDKKHGNPKEIQAAFLMGFPKELYSQDESNGMISGFVSYYLEKYNKVNFNVVATRYGHWQADTALKEAEDILTANPNLDILFTLDGNMLMGAYSAIQSAGKQGKIMVATAGGRKEELQLIQDPKSGVVSSALVDPRKEGKWAVYLAANAAKKYDVPATFHIPVVGINTENVKDFYNPKSKY